MPLAGVFGRDILVESLRGELRSELVPYIDDVLTREEVAAGYQGAHLKASARSRLCLPRQYVPK